MVKPRSSQNRLQMRSSAPLACALLAALLGCSPQPLPPTPSESGAAPPAANADVLSVEAIRHADGSWTVAATISHPDTGWDDYVNGWDAVLADGTILKKSPQDPFTRPLAHPHVEEQPFTRRQEGLEIPVGVARITVRAHDLVSGWGGREVEMDLTRESGPGYTVRLLDPP